MQNIHIALGARSYDICISTGLLGRDEDIVAAISGEQVFILTNEVVAPLYLDRLTAGLGGKKVFTHILPDGEQEKTLTTISAVLDAMLESRLDRTAIVIALGGGVIGDIAGFAAACYQRGIGYIQVPTTLLAQVDSSVGGKTGVNHPMGKNMIGAFHQPRRVIIDPLTLKTLEARQFAAGLAEIIKYGLIRDRRLFDWLEQNMPALVARQNDALEYAIEQSCRCKAAIVEQDEHESGMRALLNFGHTFGHAIEAATAYQTWLHGEAVALGMVMAAHMSREMGRLSDEAFTRIESLLQAAGLPTTPSDGFPPARMLELMASDKKVVAATIRLILLKDIGHAFITSDYPTQTLGNTLERYCLGN